ncbi:hypothetical protein QBZ16_004335 [Prototheca wickerhamii]|uniref:Strawberry notch-like protein n=1 Tax=Prototheca wickerhamii TaxID=3111 RepID=A0AAD9MK48_PROWI|nr:hypothetical protein QBZ16_004335 [Prototheca wickerhamii]
MAVLALSAVSQLLRRREYVCPTCKSLQSFTLDDNVERLILAQATMNVLRIRQWAQHQDRMKVAQPAADQDRDLFEDEGEDAEIEGETFTEYWPAKLPFGAPHPDPVVETASLASVAPPDIVYELAAQRELVDAAALSALQLESVVYACQRHEQRLADGSRAGFFIGDGAGVGKGRTIAGLVYENWKRGRRRHLWISIGSDLRVDARRDLDDVGGADIPLHALNKLPYGKLDSKRIGIQEGVVFLTYASLISASDRGTSRYKQLVQWCGAGFEGLIVLDESHKAKNLVPEAGQRPTVVGQRVQDLQRALPAARTVYCSATGASEPRNMGYMTRLGLWGPGAAAFASFQDFLDAVQAKGGGEPGDVAVLELVAMEMKALGAYVCRTLSFAGAEFATVQAALEDGFRRQYAAAAGAWCALYRAFLEEERELERLGCLDGEAAVPWRGFWAAHQRFFRHMCMSAKVPTVVRLARAALAAGKCVVIGLQSTGEARTTDAIAGRGEELEDFVSGPRELITRLVSDLYPLPPDPAARRRGGASDEDEDDALFRAIAAPAGARDRAERSAKAKQVRYREFEEHEGVYSTDDGSDEEGSGSEEERSLLEDDEEASSDPDAQASSSSEEESDEESGSGASMVESDTTEEVPEERREEADAPLSSDAVSEESAVAARKSLARLASSASLESGQPPAKRSKSALAHRSSSSLTQGSEDEERLARLARRVAARAVRRGVRLAEREARREAAAARAEALLRARGGHGAPRRALPSNALDVLIDELGGPPAVAEMTGRKGRLVRAASSRNVVYEARNASGVEKGATLDMINVHERAAFMSGAKLVAVISEAASAGISLHADRRAANQRRRVHLTLELPWSADKAIQQFGRSHRANQAWGPQYRLVVTPLGGERRFASAVARRLETLGALTQGDRRAGPSLSAFNYESGQGQKALRALYEAALSGTLPDGLALPPALEPRRGALLAQARAAMLAVGLIRPAARGAGGGVPIEALAGYLERGEAPLGVGTVEDKDKIDVPRFLNRLLGLPPDAQDALFGLYQALLDAGVEAARKQGELDRGIMRLHASRVEVLPDAVVLFKDASSGATARLHTIKLDRGVDWAAAKAQLEAHGAPASAEEGATASPLGSPDKAAPGAAPATDDAPDVTSGFYKARMADAQGIEHILLALRGPSAYRIVRPGTGLARSGMSLKELEARYVAVKDEKEAERLWSSLYELTLRERGKGRPSVRVKRMHVATGAVLRCWGAVRAAVKQAKLKSGRRIRVVRVDSTDEPPVRLVGMVIPEEVVEDVKRRMGVVEQSKGADGDGTIVVSD